MAKTSPRAAPRRRKSRTRLVLVSVGFLGLAVAFGLFLLTRPVTSDRLCTLGLGLLGRELGLDIGAESCTFDPLRADVEINHLSAVDPRRAGRTIRFSKVRLRLSPLQALAGGLQVERLELASPEIVWSVDKPVAASGVAQSSKACWLQTLRLVHLEYLNVTDAQLAISIGKDRLSLRGVALESHRAAGSYRMQLRATGDLVLSSLSEPITLSQIASDLTLQPGASRAVVKNTVLVTDGLELAVEGSLENLCEPTPDLAVSAKLDVARWSHLLEPKIQDPKGKAEVSARVFSGKSGIQSTLDARLSGVALAGYRLPETELNARIDAKHFTVDRAHLMMDKGMVDARGEIGIGGKFPITIDADLKGVTFAPTVDRLLLHHSHVDFRADIHARVSGQLNGFGLSGDATGEIDQFAVDDEAWDHTGPKGRVFAVPPLVHFQSGLRVDAEKFRFEHASFRSPESEVDTSASIYYDGKKGLKLTAELPKVSLTELRAIAGLPWQGGGSIEVGINGPFDDLRVEGRVDFGDFVLDNVNLGALRGPIVFHGGVLEAPGEECRIGATKYSLKGSVDLAHDLATEAELRSEDGRIEDLLSAVEGLAPVLRDTRAVLHGTASGQGHIHGPFLSADAEVRIQAPSFDLFQRHFGAGVISADLHAGKLITVHELSASLGEGRIDLTGTVTTDWQAALRAKATGIPLEMLLQPVNGQAALAAGVVSADGALAGSLSDLQPAGTLTASNLSLLGVPVGRGSLQLTTDHGVLRFSGAVGDELNASGTIRLVGQGPYEAVVVGDTRHLDTYLAGAGYRDPPSGALEGKAVLHGEFLSPEKSEIELTLGRFEIAKKHLKLQSDGPVKIAWNEGDLELEPVTLVGVHSHLKLGGSLSADDLLEMSLAGDLDLRQLEGFLSQVERLSGSLHIGASLHGPRASPLVVGSASLSGGQFSWVGLPLTARKVEGTAQFSHRKVVLSELHGELNGGETTLGGEATLDGFRVSRYDLSADLSGVPMRIPDSIPSRVRGRLTLVGEPNRDLTLGGEVHIEYARYNQAMDLDALLERFRLKEGTVGGTLDVRRFDIASALQSLSRDRPSPLRFDVRLIADGDVRAENNVVQMPLNGDVRLTGTVESPGLIGRLDGKDGLAEFRGHQYHVTQALFSFDDRDRISPSVDVSADTDARQYRVFVRLFGNASDYKLQLRSQPALTEDDIVKLMTFGVTTQDTAGLGGAGSLGKASYLGDVLWNVSGLHDQVRRVIPHNQVIRDLSVNLGSAYIQATGQVEPVAQIESRVLTDNLKLRAQLPLSEPTGKRAEAEYQLSDHLSLQAEWNNDYSDYSVGDFGMDMRARWEFGE
jgi:translocation and assembly module TamB